jgi:uridine kinase
MYIVGIAGGSGSGKTTFAQKILNSVGSPNVVILHQDSYYLPVPPEHLQVHGEGNFDHPDAFDWPLLRAHLKTLKEGGIISVPVYDYKISRRTSEVELIGPCQVVLLEGIYSLWDETIRDLFDVKVYLHVDADIRFIRRLHSQTVV